MLLHSQGCKDEKSKINFIFYLMVCVCVCACVSCLVLAIRDVGLSVSISEASVRLCFTAVGLHGECGSKQYCLQVFYFSLFTLL